MASLIRTLVIVAMLTITPMPALAVESDLVSRLEALITQGSGEAAYHLGMIHHIGLEGVARDPRRAFELFRIAADAGDPLGAYKVGCFYAGQGADVVADDPELALRYKLIAAEAGYALAQMDVAAIYRDRGDDARALHWLEAAARQGYTPAFIFARRYLAGDGALRDPARAILYGELLRRDLEVARAELGSSLPDGTEQPTTDQMLEAVGVGMVSASDADRARAAELIEAWRAEPSAVTIRAATGLERAQRLVALDAAEP